MRLNTKAVLSPAMLALALSLPVAAPVAAWAQNTTAPAKPAQSREERVEQRIADMYATLHITHAQDALWNQFAQVMLDNAQAMDAAVAKANGDVEKQSALDILDNYATIAQQHAENVQRLSGAFSVLYAALSPEQKKDADEMFRARPMGHGGHMHGGEKPAESK